MLHVHRSNEQHIIESFDLFRLYANCRDRVNLLRVLALFKSQSPALSALIDQHNHALSFHNEELCTMDTRVLQSLFDGIFSSLQQLYSGQPLSYRGHRLFEHSHSINHLPTQDARNIEPNNQHGHRYNRPTVHSSQANRQRHGFNYSATSHVRMTSFVEPTNQHQHGTGHPTTRPSQDARNIAPDNQYRGPGYRR